MNDLNRILAAVAVGTLILAACTAGDSESAAQGAAMPPVEDPAVFWNSASVYFLLTDRFYNGDPSNDLALGRAQDGAVLRSFQGGDLAGVLEKLEQGYFDALGVDAIWLTPFVEQIRGSVDEGTGKSYGFHGYWTRDWTAVEPALGREDDLRALVNAAHRRGIRVLMDAVINHTGPVTPLDPEWPDDWVRTGPRCRYEDYTTTVDCTLVANLPDIRTDRDDAVELPRLLIDKWEREGRVERELAELDVFFERTGYPRAPRYYVMKWLTDWVREFGFDGYRMDTAKHFEETIAAQLKQEAELAFADWKAAHPDQVIDDLPFFMVGEVYNYDVNNGRGFDFGDRTVDFFQYGYDALINFGFKRDAAGSLDRLFARYAAVLREDLQGFAILNYVSSHDDGAPYDRERDDPLGAGTRLLLAPGGAQIYYGDELARPLTVNGARGDANLRSFMNWDDVERRAAVLDHWRKLGRFRRAHPAVGAGVHRRLQTDPYVFSRTLETGELVDRVLVAMDQDQGTKRIPVFGVFPEGAELFDAYSGETGPVIDGQVVISSEYGLVLLGER